MNHGESAFIVHHEHYMSKDSFELNDVACKDVGTDHHSKYEPEFRTIDIARDVNASVIKNELDLCNASTAEILCALDNRLWTEAEDRKIWESLDRLNWPITGAFSRRMNYFI
jgi:hypothetical protein